MRAPKSLTLVVFAAMVACSAAMAATSGGSLDPTFDGDGRVTTDLGAKEGARAVAVLSDGKILVASTNALVRYEPSGALDATFDGDGVCNSPGFPAADMAIAPDGKIVLVGTVNDPDTLADIAVARFNADCTPDTTFGGDGLVTTDYDDSNDGAHGVVVQPDGKVVVIGFTDASHELGTGIVGRYLADGTPDPSFGFGDPFPYGVPDYPSDVALQPDGKIVVAGEAYQLSGGGAHLRFAVARFRANGNRDTSFSGDGAVRTRFGADRSDGAAAVAIQADGKILAAGYTRKGASSDFALARYKPGGRLDTAFSGDGKQRTDFGGRSDGASGVVLQANGRAVLAGFAGGRFAVARYRTGGKLDATFGGDGKVRTRFGSNDGDSASDVALQADGRILVGGWVKTTAGSIDIGLARYLP
jgi:uncharacterized delta-60 repeat protein